MAQVIFVRFKDSEEHVKVELEAIAEKESRTLASVVRQALKEFLKRRKHHPK